MPGTFISYRREDAAGYAGRLRESLERRLGAARVFRDVDTLRPGQDFVQAIESRLSDCAVMIAVIGREWATFASPALVATAPNRFDGESARTSWGNRASSSRFSRTSASYSASLISGASWS